MDDNLEILKAFCRELIGNGEKQVGEEHRAFYALALIRVIRRIEQLQFEEIMEKDGYWEKKK